MSTAATTTVTAESLPSFQAQHLPSGPTQTLHLDDAALPFFHATISHNDEVMQQRIIEVQRECASIASLLALHDSTLR